MFAIIRSLLWTRACSYSGSRANGGERQSSLSGHNMKRATPMDIIYLDDV
jgi:hypothetical protein